MKQRVRYSCIIFDLNGTLICSTEAWFSAARDLSLACGRTADFTLDDVHRRGRDGVSDVIRLAAGYVSEEVTAAFWNLVEGRYLSLVKPVNDLAETLTCFRSNFILAVFSNKARYRTIGWLRHFNIFEYLT